ncbi:DUF5666 domain-containing protein [Thaumasiovibrio subtropicus]|uniref:DUF5666 domain-containing protein n=1 Tax=Thaumasiovibrio subtropicus TaxID=1891207 RepID=UPI000B354438|nr:DUF5666 domain-containing protein [Thaumasiovibrio subtropicus]
MKKLILASAMAALLAGCGGSGSSSSPSIPSKTGWLDGQIQQISHSQQSLRVNGHQLDATHADINYRGETIPFADLSNGMRAQFDVADNKISEMKLDPSLVGEVSEVSGNKFTVNGIELEFNGLAGIRKGDWVMVTTYPNADGGHEVASVSKIDPIARVEIEGRVSGLTSSEFNLGTLRVDYSNADVDDRDELENGAWVEVYGDFYDNNNFKAYEVEVEDDADFDDFEIEGMVTWVNSDYTLFELNGRLRIEIDDDTEFDDGRRSDLTSGRWVEVEVEFRQGRLVAEEIDFEDGGDYDRGREFEVEGRAQYRNNQLSINDIVIDTDGRTEWDDGLRPSNIDGQWVEIEGKYINSRFVAFEIEKEDRDDDIELEGPVNNNSLWGYQAGDNSLRKYEGRWVDLDCDFEGNKLYDCDD